MPIPADLTERFHPGATATQVAKAYRVSVMTASRWMRRLSYPLQRAHPFTSDHHFLEDGSAPPDVVADKRVRVAGMVAERERKASWTSIAIKFNVSLPTARRCVLAVRPDLMKVDIIPTRKRSPVRKLYVGQIWQVYDGAPSRTLLRRILSIGHNDVQYIDDHDVIKTAPTSSFRRWLARFRCELIASSDDA